MATTHRHKIKQARQAKQSTPTFLPTVMLLLVIAAMAAMFVKILFL